MWVLFESTNQMLTASDVSLPTKYRANQYVGRDLPNMRKYELTTPLVRLNTLSYKVQKVGKLKRLPDRAVRFPFLPLHTAYE